MGCEYCRYGSGHAPGCPYYESEHSNHFCKICDDNILIGEEYVVNHNGDYAHWECVNYAKDLAKFFDIDIREMENEDY